MEAARELAEKSRVPLTRERVLRAAVELADERGIDALTMRNLGQELGVEAMSLYNHVSNKDDVLDGVVEVIVDEVLAVVDGIAPPRTRRVEGGRCAGGSSPRARCCSGTAGRPACSSRARTCRRA